MTWNVSSRAATLGTPPSGSRAAYISPDLGVANVVTKSSYQVQVQANAYGPAPSSCNGLPGGQAGQGFVAAADALVPINARYFATNAGNQIYEHSATLLGVMPEVGAPPVGQPLRR